MTDDRIDTTETAQLLNDVFDFEPPLTEAELDWYYVDNPAGRASVGEAHDDGRKVGNYALIPFDLERNDGSTVRLGLGVDLSVHPDARGTGAYRRTVEHAYAVGAADGLDGILGVANAQSAPRMAATMGWRVLTPLPVRLLVPFGRPVAGATFDDDDPQLAAALAAALPSELPPGPSFTPRWSRDLLLWRLAKPRGRYRIRVCDEVVVITTRTTIAGIRFAVVCKTISLGEGVRVPSRRIAATAAAMERSPLVVHWGTSLATTARGIPLPRSRMPSPLELVLHSFHDGFDRERFELSGFEFLDFDGY